MRADELSPPTGDTFKFDKIGDTIQGEIVYVGEWQHQVNKFNDRDEEVARIGINTDGDTLYVWPRRGSAMAQALAEALREADLAELAPGQTVKLRYDADKDTGKGNPMKVFRAKITPGEPSDTEPPF